MPDRRVPLTADPALREMMGRFLRFVDCALRGAARRGYRGKLYVWLEFPDLRQGGDVEMLWSEQRPSDTPALQVYEYDINDERAAALLASTPPGDKADA